MLEKNNLIVFSHLRWDLVYQRPQHIISRIAKAYNVLYVEEPVFSDLKKGVEMSLDKSGVIVITPILNKNDKERATITLAHLLELLLMSLNFSSYSFWYYTPTAYSFTKHLHPSTIIYDCIDELSTSKNTSVDLLELESELIAASSVVFTSCRSLYNLKKRENIHYFPDSVDKQHFSKARLLQAGVSDQLNIPFHRFGFFGVIDEQFDANLLRDVARKRPSWQFIIIGPVINIDEEVLPRDTNIHYLGAKQYEELPVYISSWDVAFLPLACNEFTRYTSPTKTAECLTAGKPVISTAIEDVVDSYADLGLVHIVNDAEEFIQSGETLLIPPSSASLDKVDAYLNGNTWDRTSQEMQRLIADSLKGKVSAI
ncbi:glycosyltransferase [Niabella ginsengisoli]|uniref:Glycosyltransferase n=1 Tax=Niabella ginsengisoli TaxID=522298 RepID=A0ABS9SKH8_9BACT|nr:glycosyltransferase [Niabella ginsengisoli]MCH5598850.1 glycosyltransferase [Niabella ginsengisoli]